MKNTNKKRPNNRVLVVGEACSDIFVYGNASRLCPDVPAPVFTPKNSINTPGMAGNTARNLESLGFKVDFIQQQEIIKKTRYIDSKLNYTFLRVDEGEDKVTPFNESIIHEREIRDYDAVVISDYGKGFLSESDIEKFCKNNANTFLDTKKILGDYCREVKIIKINSPEFERLKGNINLEDWRNKLIVTLGDRGCMYYRDHIASSGHGFHYYDVESVDVFDLSGAGDTFLAALVAKYLEPNNMEDAIIYANKKSAEAVRKKGVSVITN
jgi:D-beta-D-heptose 7-phosphate kinase/D-beta-D-heptose 1-phosphate adenosyltransferase